MSKKYAFLFPGQGAQAPGMMKDICAASRPATACLSRLSAAADEDISKLLWETDTETLSRTDRSQLAILSASLIAAAALEEVGIVPSAAAGFSLGEFPALYVSGVLSFEDAVRVVKQRGIIMQRVCGSIAERSGGSPPGMAAVVGLPPEKVAEIAVEAGGVYAANLNSPRQTVVSGTAEGLKKAETLCAAAGARRFLRLAVAGPFHSPLMQEAADEFEKALADVPFNDSKIALFSNVSGKRVASGAEAKQAAVRHLVQRVRWTDEEDALAAFMQSEGESWAILEPGPGKVLSGLWKDSTWADKWTVSPCGTAGMIAVL